MRTIKTLFVIILFCYSYSSFGQEKQKQVFTDTVDIVDFLESVYKKESKFQSLQFGDTTYNLKNYFISFVRTVDSTFDYENQSDFNNRLEDKYGVIGQLKNRIGISYSPTFPHYIDFENCEIGRQTYKNIEGSWWSFGLLINDADFAGISFNKTRKGSLEFEQCNFYAQGPRFLIWDSETRFSFKFCSFKDPTKILNSKNRLYFEHCKFKNRVEFMINSDLDMRSCMFQNLDTGFTKKKLIPYNDGQRFGNFEYQGNERREPINIQTRGTVELNEKPKLILDSCINLNNGEKSWIQIHGNYSKIKITNSNLKANLFLKADVEKEIILENNNLTGISIENSLLPEFKTYIDWNSIRNFKINVQILGDRWGNIHKSNFVNGDSSSTFRNPSTYNKLIEMYKYTFDKYKTQGNTASANSSYAEMKQVETHHWKYLFEKNKNFESFFRWQLNAFLSYFTDYGTNPAKAVIKSGWVILIFSFFYLFFPSDWDVSNRSQLLSKLKSLVSKNREKSFLATLGFVAYSGLIHVLNALTLSLNAFTTLGFGDIPTHGAARYVTIVQGFIGWFLLTIFSVSLINQVLG